MKRQVIGVLIFLGLTFLAFSCKQHYSPKPRGYFRIDLPKKEYTRLQSNLPYSFEYPTYARITPFESDKKHPNWINIDFANYKSKVYLSYIDVHDSLNKYMEDARTLAYKHSIKADAIDEQLFSFPQRKVYGILYDIKGNTASSVNFVATDSIHHFLRGALYFNTPPNEDSLAPLISFFRDDIIHLFNTLEWK
jgi:gliding motility-associated lipoprotein GldD